MGKLMALDATQTAAVQNNQSIGAVTQQLSQLDQAGTYVQLNVPQSADAIASNFMSFDVLAFPSDTPKYYMTLNLAAYHRTDINVIGSLNIYGSIRLPLPTQIVDGYNIAWDTRALGWAGALTASAIDSFRQGNIAAGLAQGVAPVGLNALQGIANQNLARPFVNALENSADAIGSVVGSAPNRFMTVVFDGPQYKEHTLSWRLVPRTPVESEQIRRLVKKLNNAASPFVKTVAFGSTLGSILWGYPDIVIASYSPNPKYLMKFKPAVIRRISANYAPAGIPTFYHNSAAGNEQVNAPEGIDLSISLLELEFWLGNENRGQDGDYNDSNDPGDVYGGHNGNVYDVNGDSSGLNPRQLNASANGFGGLTANNNNTNVTTTTQATNPVGTNPDGTVSRIVVNPHP
jgi:hypothetical protein